MEAKPKVLLFCSGWLSQWSTSTFEAPCGFEDPPSFRNFTSAEQYMMASKARLFGDREAFERIMESKNPKEIKRLGRKVAGFREDLWERERMKIVTVGNYHKFSQNPKPCESLLDTGDQLIAEASPYDRTWGTGMRASDPDARCPDKWRGANLLGKCLMAVRDHIRNGTRPDE